MSKARAPVEWKGAVRPGVYVRPFEKNGLNTETLLFLLRTIRRYFDF